MPDRLPKRLQLYWAETKEAEEQTHLEQLLLLAVLDREAVCGYGNKPTGPTGTGDWKPRHWSRYSAREDSHVFIHWKPMRNEYEKEMAKKLGPGEVAPELCMPADGHGWGRGLMQLDWADPDNLAFFAEILPDGRPAWQDARRNILFGANKLSRYIHAFDDTEAPEFYGVAAYNAGVANVHGALRGVRASGSASDRRDAVDHVTTGRNYATDVLERRNQYRRALSTPKEPENA